MSAQDNQTGAPAGAPTLDDAMLDVDELGQPLTIGFLQRLRALAAPLGPDAPESDWFALESADQVGFACIDDDCTLYAVSARDLAAWSKRLVDFREDNRRLVRELDVALNGEVGAAKQASLCDIVAQVRRQQAVQILNMSDGMRINFRAPDGRRATLHVRAVLDAAQDMGTDHAVVETMYDAMEAYPVAGEPVPLDVDQQTAAQVAALGHQIHPDMARPSRRVEE